MTLNKKNFHRNLTPPSFFISSFREEKDPWRGRLVAWLVEPIQGAREEEGEEEGKEEDKEGNKEEKK